MGLTDGKIAGEAVACKGDAVSLLAEGMKVELRVAWEVGEDG